jgi:hypothetical protein
MTEITQELWESLPKCKQGKLLEEYRYSDVQDSFWSERVIEMFTEDMKLIGIEVDKAFYSGFYSQGDGACFEGRVCDWSLFLEAAGYKDLIDVIPCSDQPRLPWHQSGHYYHEYCTTFDTDGLYLDNPHCEEWDTLRHAMWAANYGESGPLISRADEFIEFVRDKMRDLYKLLEEEYDHLTSDETVLAGIFANVDFEDIREELAQEELPLVA